MKSIFVTGLLLCLTIPSLHATGQERARDDKSTLQSPDEGKTSSTNDQIEVRTNRFNNVTTVTLKPQALVDKPEVFLAMEIETKLGERGRDRELVIAFVKLELQSKKPMFPGSEELNFLVDGQPLSAGKAKFALDGLADITGALKPGFRYREHAHSLAFDRRALEQFSQANRIELQVGPIETTLNNVMVATLREYANQVLAQHKISRERTR